MNNRYLLMRHGESLANSKEIIVSKPENAINDYGLTKQGRNQTSNAVCRAQLDQDLIIVSSDYLRARETAQIVADVLQTYNSIVLLPELRERDFGDWELRHQSNYNTVWEQDEKHPDQSINAVESVALTLARGIEVIELLEKKYTSRTILLVGHGDVLQILSAHYSGLEPRLHRTIQSIKNADIRPLHFT